MGRQMGVCVSVARSRSEAKRGGEVGVGRTVVQIERAEGEMERFNQGMQEFEAGQ